MSRSIIRSLLVLALGAVVSSLAQGCSSYAVPHQPYAPLLSRGGQVAIQARGGVTGAAAPTFAVHGAYAPIENLEVVAGADFDPVGDTSGGETLHAAGEVGIGTFAVDESLIAELIGGTAVGWGSGAYLDGFRDDGTGSGQLVANTYGVDGPYVRPFLQGVVGSRFGIAEIAGGVRFAYTWAQQSFTPFDPGTPQLQRYDATAVHLDPFVVARLAVDILRIEAMAGLALTFGDASVGPFFNAFASLGLGVVFDTWEPATPDYGADPILVPGQPIAAQP
ncbi:MAG: hypothetical protein J0L92_30975 [Deltaproteobacteria bacterium]|nr:hypothetical protein [Deltaproteobacteria bacterium]